MQYVKDLQVQKVQELLSSAKTEIEALIQHHLDKINFYGLEVDLLCCQESVNRLNAQVEQLAMVDISVRIK